MPQRRRRKRLGASTAPGMPTADAPNRVWAVDFQFDATTDGRPIKIVSIIDEHTRECLGGLVDRSITADVLVSVPRKDHLEIVWVAPRGRPVPHPPKSTAAQRNSSVDHSTSTAVGGSPAGSQQSRRITCQD